MTITDQDLPVLNVELLTDLVKWAGQDEAHLERVYQAKGWPEWYQGVWIQASNGGEATMCGTKACIAGNAVMQSEGWIPGPLFIDFTKPPGAEERRPYDSRDYLAVPIKVTGWQADNHPLYERDEARDLTTIDTVATDVLGLTSYESSALFDADNSLADVVQLALLIAETRGVELSLPAVLEDLAGESDWYCDSAGYYYRSSNDDD